MSKALTLFMTVTIATYIELGLLQISWEHLCKNCPNVKIRTTVTIILVQIARHSTYNPCFAFWWDIVGKTSDGITEFHMGANHWIFKLWSKSKNKWMEGWTYVVQLLICI